VGNGPEDLVDYEMKKESATAAATRIPSSPPPPPANRKYLRDRVADMQFAFAQVDVNNCLH
jgi:hypothetical protein